MTMNKEQVIEILLKLPKNITKSELEALFGITKTNPWVNILSQLGFVIYEFLENNPSIVPYELKKVINKYGNKSNISIVCTTATLSRLAIIPILPFIGVIAANTLVATITMGSLYWVYKHVNKPILYLPYSHKEV